MRLWLYLRSCQYKFQGRIGYSLADWGMRLFARQYHKSDDDGLRRFALKMAVALRDVRNDTRRELIKLDLLDVFRRLDL